MVPPSLRIGTFEFVANSSDRGSTGDYLARRAWDNFKIVHGNKPNHALFLGTDPHIYIVGDMLIQLRKYITNMKREFIGSNSGEIMQCANAHKVRRAEDSGRPSDWR